MVSASSTPTSRFGALVFGVVSGGSLWGTGDVFAQYLDHRLKKGKLKEAAAASPGDPSATSHAASFLSVYDPLRTARMTAFGACVAGPLLLWWYPFLRARTAAVLGEHRVTKPAGLAFSIFLDQCVFEPPYLSLFLGYAAVSDGKSVPEAGEEIVRSFPGAYLADCSVWPIVQVFNFSLVAPKFQGTVVNAVAIGWSCFLSWWSHRNAHEGEDEKKKE